MATLRYQTERLDGDGHLLPWYTAGHAYTHMMDTMWAWLPTVPNDNGYPMYYLNCGFQGPDTPIIPFDWENDWGERVPNIVEFARLYYGYCGNTGPLAIAKSLLDYALANGITGSGANWPNFPYGTGQSGNTTINGANNWLSSGSILIDLGADMGMSFYKMYLIDGTPAYRTAAINTANTLATKIGTGNATTPPWPYVVQSSNGNIISPYCSNWAGALTLFDLLIANGEPNTVVYTSARTTLKNWLLDNPMDDGHWVSGHSDNNIDINNDCHTTATNMALYMLDNPTWDPDHATNLPGLLNWCETRLVAVNDGDGTYNPTGVYKGAHVPCEQPAFQYRMGYQTARLGAVYARWYLTSGNATHKDIAYHNLNYNTYMMQDSGLCADGPTDRVGWWFGDCYGEGLRMYFHGMAGMPDYAPSGESHLLYTRDPVKNVTYGTSPGSVQYTATGLGTDYLRTAFNPATITVAGSPLSEGSGYTKTSLGGTDYAVTIPRSATGVVILSETGQAPTGTITLSVR